MLIYVLFLFIYREIGEFMDKNLLYNSGPFGRCKLTRWSDWACN